MSQPMPIESCLSGFVAANKLHERLPNVKFNRVACGYMTTLIEIAAFKGHHGYVSRAIVFTVIQSTQHMPLRG